MLVLDAWKALLSTHISPWPTLHWGSLTDTYSQVLDAIDSERLKRTHTRVTRFFWSNELIINLNQSQSIRLIQILCVAQNEYEIWEILFQRKVSHLIGLVLAVRNYAGGISKLLIAEQSKLPALSHMTRSPNTHFPGSSLTCYDFRGGDTWVVVHDSCYTAWAPLPHTQSERENC